MNIGCALVHRSKLLIMDEPTVGIDPQSRNYLLKTDETDQIAHKLRTLMTGSGVIDADALRQLVRSVNPMIESLSTRERDIIRLVAKGMTNKFVFK